MNTIKINNTIYTLDIKNYDDFSAGGTIWLNFYLENRHKKETFFLLQYIHYKDDKKPTEAVGIYTLYDKDSYDVVWTTYDDILNRYNIDIKELKKIKETIYKVAAAKK